MVQASAGIAGGAWTRNSPVPEKASGIDRLRRRVSAYLDGRDTLKLLPECVAVIGFIGVIWFSIGAMLGQQYDAAERAAVRDTGNLAHAFEANTERIVAGIDQILLSVRTAYADAPDSFDPNAWQRRQMWPDRFMVQLAMIGLDGFARGATMGGAAMQRVDLSDQDYFRAQLVPDRDALFISKPVAGPAGGQWTVQFTRKVLNQDGGLAGVLVVSLGCDELSRFYDRLELGHGMLALAGTDGIIRARRPLREGGIGSDISGDPFFGRIRAGRHGATLASSPIDGVERVVSFRRLPDQPLVVLVGFDTAQVFQSYSTTRARALMAGGAATVGVLLLGTLWILLRRRGIASKRALRLTLETISQGIVLLDASGHAPVMNRRALELLDLRPEELPGSGMVAWPLATEGGGVAAGGTVMQLARADGRIIEVQGHPTPFGGAVLTYTDVTDRKLAEARILHLAHHDALTGLPNRTLLNMRIAEAVAQAAREANHIALFCLDLDGFKTINGTMGHDIGDVVLCRFADRLRALVRPGDTVARTGGDEFTILVRGLAKAATAENVARRMLDGLPLPVDSGSCAPTLGSSIGIALYPEDGADGPTLLKNADTALYRAKAEGKGGFCRFEGWMDRSLAERRSLERDLRLAIERREFEVFFQPQFTCDTLRVVGLEALLRWRHVERGFVPPGAFIPLAEECGLIVPIGRMVLEQSCVLAAGWQPRCRVAVNLSPVQFHDGTLVPLLSGILRRSGFPPSLLELEVTEGVLIKDEDQALATLHALKALGVHLVLDDFGTGYSSLSYLRRFPFDGIKIDKTFVHAQQQDSGTRTILEAVLAMSKRLNLRVVAEGVETEEQLAMLREQGCTEIQGFLLGRPMPAGEVENFLRSETEWAGRDGRRLRLAASNRTVAAAHRGADAADRNGHDLARRSARLATTSQPATASPACHEPA